MKSAKAKKILLSAVSVMLVATLAVAGTVAYLQDSTEDVVNTFSTNNVNVDLKETTDDSYNIVPGTSETKDPTVTVNASLPAYVYVEVTDETQGLVTYEIADGWELLDGYDNVYYRVFTPGTDDEGNPVTKAEYSVLKDDKVSYDAKLTNEDMLDEEGNPKTDIQLTFKAYAIQKEGFDTAKAGWLQIPIEVSTAAELAEALEDGGIVVLTADVPVVPEGEGEDLVPQMSVSEDTILHLDNNTLSVDPSVYGDNLSYTPALIEVVDGATLTIDGDGTITAEAGNNNSYGINVNGGTLIINGGNYYGAPTAIQVQQGSLVINGGFFDLAPTCKAQAPNYAKYVVNAIDDYYDGTAAITITGGTFVNFDPSANPEGEGTSYVANGYHVESETKENGEIWYTVVPDPEYPVSDSESLSAALTNVQGESAIISIASDIDQITGIKTESDTNLTIDFNENTVSVAQPVGSTGTITNGMQLLRGSTVSLVNGTYTTSSPSVKTLIQNYSNLTLKDFTLDAHDQSQVSYVLSNNCGDVLITGATNILADNGKCAFDAYYWPKNGYTSGVRVVIDENMTGLIKGEIEFTDDRSDLTGAAEPALHSIIIKGGYFTEDPSTYVPAGYKVIDSTETFTIGGNTYTANYQVVPET